MRHRSVCFNYFDFRKIQNLKIKSLSEIVEKLRFANSFTVYLARITYHAFTIVKWSIIVRQMVATRDGSCVLNNPLRNCSFLLSLSSSPPPPPSTAHVSAFILHFVIYRMLVTIFWNLQCRQQYKEAGYYTIVSTDNYYWTKSSKAWFTLATETEADTDWSAKFHTNPVNRRLNRRERKGLLYSLCSVSVLKGLYGISCFPLRLRFRLRR